MELISNISSRQYSYDEDMIILLLWLFTFWAHLRVAILKWKIISNMTSRYHLCSDPQQEGQENMQMVEDPEILLNSLDWPVYMCKGLLWETKNASA